MTARLSSDADANLKENKQQETVLNNWTYADVNLQHQCTRSGNSSYKFLYCLCHVIGFYFSHYTKLILLSSCLNK